MKDTKTPPISLSTVTARSLRDTTYLDVFPEFYALALVTENSTWHDNQNVFDHATAVVAGLEQVLLFASLPVRQKNFLTVYLSQKVGVFSRKEALQMATLLHDIAKKDTLVVSADGTSRCPGHELIAASQVPLYADRFGFDVQDATRIERIVRYHGLISDFLTLLLANGANEMYLKLFSSTVGDVAIELVLLMHADLLGSDLHKSDKKAFDDRINVLSWILKELCVTN